MLPQPAKPQSHWIRNSLLGAGALGGVLGAGYLGDKYFNGGQAVSSLGTSLSKGLFNTTGIDTRNSADVAKNVDKLMYSAPRSANGTDDNFFEASGAATNIGFEGYPWAKALFTRVGPAGWKDVVNPITGQPAAKLFGAATNFGKAATPLSLGGKLLSGLNGLGAYAGGQQAYEGADYALQGNNAFANYMHQSPMAEKLFKWGYGGIGAAANSNPITRFGLLPVTVSNAYNKVVDATAENVQHPVETGRLGSSYNVLMDLAKNNDPRGVAEWHKQMLAVPGTNPTRLQQWFMNVTPYQNREAEMLQYLKTNNPDAYAAAKQVIQQSVAANGNRG